MNKDQLHRRLKHLEERVEQLQAFENTPDQVVVEAHSSSIRVESPPNGSTFEIAFPTILPSQTTKNPKPQPPSIFPPLPVVKLHSMG